MNYNQQGFTEFRKDFTEAVQALENKHGINMSLGAITYDDEGFRVKITAREGAAEFGKNLPTISDFTVGDMVTIDHKKYNNGQVFNVIKINNKKIKVQNGKTIISAPPSMLRIAFK